MRPGTISWTDKVAIFIDEREREASGEPPEVLLRGPSPLSKESQLYNELKSF